MAQTPHPSGFGGLPRIPGRLASALLRVEPGISPNDRFRLPPDSRDAIAMATKPSVGGVRRVLVIDQLTTLPDSGPAAAFD